MNVNLASINWIAVIVTALAVFFTGALWYTVLFGKLWQRLNGFSDEKIKQMQAAKPPPLFFGGMLASYLLMAALLAVLLSAFGVHSWLTGAAIGATLWLGVAVPLGVTAWLPSDRHLGLFAIDWAYQFVILVMSGAILGGWVKG